MKGIVAYHLIFFLCNCPLFGFIPYEFKANRITKPPVIDGYLDDKAWQEATIIDKDFRDWNYDGPDYGKIAPVKTIVLAGYDNENLYFGFICYENEMKKLRANKKSQSQLYPVTEDDNIWISLNTYVDRPERYIFTINPNGVNSAGYQIETKLGNLYETSIINIEWYSAGRILDTFWTVEVQIPFQSLHFPSNYIDYWRIDFRRRSPHRNYGIYKLSPAVRGSSIFTYYARMYINDKICGIKKIEILPYGVNGLTIDSLSRNINIRSGFSAKYFFSYNNILDLAFLPDFSQIETDMPQIDVNTTSALYYEEKRPFFLERKTFFETPIEVFYSRMVNNPFIALKFTATLKDYYLGYILGVDKDIPFILPFSERSFVLATNKNGFCNILRVRKNLTVNTYSGLMLTDRELFDGFNRVYGFDGNFLFAGNSFRYQGLGSWTKEPSDTTLFNGYGINFNGHTARFDGESFFGEAFYFEFSRRERHLNLMSYFKGISPTFRADNGYISSNDYTKFVFVVDFPFGIKRYLFENVTPRIKFEQSHRYFGTKTGMSRGGLVNIQFRYLTSTQFSYQLSSKYYQNTWFKDMWSYSTSLSTSGIRNTNLGIYLNYGRAINYYSVPLSLGYRLYPSVWFNLQLGGLSTGLKYHRYLFWAQRFKDWIYDQKTFELNLSYAISRFANIRIIGQYNSNTKSLLIAPLFSFTPTPLTLFYLGANHNFTNEAPFDLNAYDHIRSQIFLKIQYLFRH